MVCQRCISAVDTILKRNDLTAKHIRMGEVILDRDAGAAELRNLSTELAREGFELLDDQRMQMIEKIKTLIIKKVQSGSIEEGFSIRQYIISEIHKDYSSLSRLFSSIEGITLEHYFILQRIEKIKELLLYNELSLSQIAFNLGYTSSQHLSNQFKKFTGMTATEFKKIGAGLRKGLDSVGQRIS